MSLADGEYFSVLSGVLLLEADSFFLIDEKVGDLDLMCTYFSGWLTVEWLFSIANSDSSRGGPSSFSSFIASIVASLTGFTLSNLH